MADSTIRGKVHFIDETKTYGQKGFRKRQVVIEQDTGRFTNYLPFDFIQEGCDAADELNVGDEVEIAYRLSGRKWQKDPRSEVKYFVSLEAMRFQKLGAAGSRASDSPAAHDTPPLGEEPVYDDSDVPF